MRSVMGCKLRHSTLSGGRREDMTALWSRSHSTSWQMWRKALQHPWQTGEEGAAAVLADTKPQDDWCREGGFRWCSVRKLVLVTQMDLNSVTLVEKALRPAHCICPRSIDYFDYFLNCQINPSFAPQPINCIDDEPAT